MSNGRYSTGTTWGDLVRDWEKGRLRAGNLVGLADVGDPGGDAPDPDGTPGAGDPLGTPTGLSLSSTVFFDNYQGHAVATVTAVWDPVTNNHPSETASEDADPDRSPVVDYLTSYRVAGGTWSREGGTGGLTTVKFALLPVGSAIQVRVRARTRSGQVGGYATASITAAADTTPPPKPSPPTIVGTFRGASVRWNGTFADGAVQPADFAYVQAELSLNADMSSPVDGGSIPAGGGGTVVTPLGITAPAPVYARLRAYDHSHNPSDWSNVVTGGTIPVVAADIGGGAVTSAALADAAVTAAKLLDGAVVNAKLDGLAVTVDKIADNAVIARTILAGQVITEKLAANAVTAAKIDALAVTTEKLNAGAVTTAKVEANAITSAEIAAGAVTADEVYTYAMTGKVITGGLIRTGISGQDRIEIVDEYAYDAYAGIYRELRDSLRWIRGGDGAIVAELRGYMGDVGAYGAFINGSVQLGNLFSTVYQVGRRDTGNAHSRVRGGVFNHTTTGGAARHNYGTGMDNNPACLVFAPTAHWDWWISDRDNLGFEISVRYPAGHASEGAAPGDGAVVSGLFYAEDVA